MLHGEREYPQPLPAVQHASALRLVVGAVLAALLTWLVTRAFQLM
jgi:hypothetical protein